MPLQSTPTLVETPRAVGRPRWFAVDHVRGWSSRLYDFPLLDRVRIFDRYLLRAYASTWFICLISLVGLYVVIDLFENLDEFYRRTSSFGAVAQNMINYYQYRFFRIFDFLSGIICQMAAITTLGMMQRRNEVLPMLMAGVPIRRMLYPLLAASAAVAGLGVANREAVLPKISEQVQREPSNSLGERQRRIRSCYDSQGVVIDGKYGFQQGKTQYVTGMMLVFPPDGGGRLPTLHAEVGYYQPPARGRPGGWLLENTDRKTLPVTNPKLKQLPDGRMFYETEVSFLFLVRTQRWSEFASTAELLRTARARPAERRFLELQIHRRLIRPVMEVVTVLLAIPFVIYRQGRQLPLSLVISLTAFLLYRSADYMASHLAFPLGLLPPSLGAWLPLILFGPIVLYLHSELET